MDKLPEKFLPGPLPAEPREYNLAAVTGVAEALASGVPETSRRGWRMR